MDEKKNRKKLKITLPLFSGNLAKSLVFGLIIIAAIAGAALLQMKEITQIYEDGYVVTGEVNDVLKNGMSDPANQETVSLYGVSSYEKIYSRLGSLYVGEGEEKLNKAYPEFLGSGSGIRFLDSGATLIGEDMTTRLQTYDGLRMNDGNTFGEDGMQADVENFVLTGLTNGLYITSQNMKLTYASTEDTVPADSVVYLGDSEVRYYSPQDGALHYGEVTGLMAAQIQIGNLNMGYREFLDLLKNPSTGSGVDNPSSEPASLEGETQEGQIISAGNVVTTTGEQGNRENGDQDSENGANDTGKGKDQNGSSDKNDHGTAANGSTASASNGASSAAGDSSSSSKGSSGSSSNGSGGSSSGSNKDSGSSSGSSGSSGSADKNSGSGQGSGTGNSGNTSNGSNGNNNNGKDPGKSDVINPSNGNGSGQDDPSGDDNGEDIGDQVPTVTNGDFTPEVYHIRTKVNVDDAYGQLYKLTYKLYWGTSDLKTIRLRKSIRSTKLDDDGNMDIDLSLVPPGTTVRIEGTFTYYNSEGDKIEKDFLPEGGIKVKTYTMEEGLEKGLLERITVSYDNSQEILPRQTNALQLPELTTNVPDIMQSYLYRVAVRVTPEGKKDYLDMAYGSSDLKKLKNGTSVAWVSENTVVNTDFLGSNTLFHYEIMLTDKFGNTLPLQTSAGQSGDLTAYLSGIAATAKRTPSVTITEARVSNPDAETIGTKTLNLKLINADNADLLAEQVTTSRGQVSRKLYLQVSTVQNGIEQPVAIDQVANGDLKTLYDGTWIVLDPEQMTQSSGQKLVLKNLPAGKGTTYHFTVFGNYNLTPDNTQNLTRESDHMREQVGSYQSAALAITRLGYGYYSLDASAQDTTATVTARMTDSTGTALRALFSRFEIRLVEGDASSIRNAKEKYAVQLEKSKLSGKIFPDSGEYVLAEESNKYKVVVKGTAGEDVWSTLCNKNPQITINYENLSSTLYYQTQVNSYVEQGYTGQGTKEHDVTGTSCTSTFRMIRLKPVVSCENFYTVSNFIEIRGLQIYDKDGTISGSSTEGGTKGNVVVQLEARNTSGGWDVAQTLAVDATSNPNERLDNIRFKNLKNGQEYRVRFIAASYNQTFVSSNMVTAKPLADEELDKWMLTTGEGVTASLSLLGASEALAYIQKADGTGGSIDSMNLFNSEDVTKGAVLNSNGVLSSNGSYWTTDYMKVESGDVIMFYRINQGSNGNYVSFYTTDDESSAVSLWGSNKRINLNAYNYRTNYGATYGYMDYMLIQVPDGVSYMRLSSSSSTTYQSGPSGSKILSLKEMGLLQNGKDSVLEEELYHNAFHADTWKQKTTLVAATLKETSSSSYALSSPMEVYAGNTYVMTGGSPDSKSLVGFYDSNDQLISVLDNVYYGYKFQAPKADTNVAYMRIAAYTDAVNLESNNNPKGKLRVWRYNENMVDSGQILMPSEDGSFYGNIRAQVNDPDGNLKTGKDSDERAYTLRWYKAEGVDGTTAATGQRIDGGGDYTFTGKTCTQDHQMKLDGYCSYSVAMYGNLYGEEILLTELGFTTEETTYSLETDADLDKLALFPYGKFTMVKDIETSRGRVVDNFYGKIDGQGHTITKKSSTSLIAYLRDGAEISNLEVNWEMQLNSQIRDTASLVAINYGTIKNVVVQVNLKGAFPLHNVGGIVRENYGNIENFAVNYGTSLTAKSYWGGICAQNLNGGIIKNGYAYVNSNVRLSFASAQYFGNQDNVVYHDGSILGINQPGGVVQNVYAVGDIYNEKQKSYNALAANVIGTNNGGQVRNVLSRGDHYVYTINNTNNAQGAATLYFSAGNGIGTTWSSGKEENIYYLSPQGQTYQKKGPIQAETSDLWNSSFMSGLLNGEGQFRVDEMIKAGYYPKVEMPEALMEKQPSITLPSASGSTIPTVLDATMVESGTDANGEDYVIANIRFINSRRRQVTEIAIKNVQCEIIGYPESDGDYTVQVKLTKPEVYHSSYEFQSFTYKTSSIGSATRTEEYGANTSNGEKYLDIEFWRSISNLEEWNQYLGEKMDLEGNYQIIADIDFTGESGKNVREIRRQSVGGGVYKSFTGSLRGATGEDRTGTATLTNYPAELGYLVEDMNGGSISNLSVVGFTSGADLQASQGLVANAQDVTFDHIQMKDVNLESGVVASAGALVGTANSSTVTYCSVDGVKITTSQNTGGNYRLAVGGLVGTADATDVKNSFASDVEITAKEGGGVSGIGGLIGKFSGNATVTSTYAAGSIDSAFGTVGGLVGCAGNNITRAWTDVSIVSVANNIGGIVGSADKSITVSSAFAAGEIYSKTASLNNVGRIYGSGAGTSVVTVNRCYAYEGQAVNGQITKDAMDAKDLYSSEELSGDSGRVLRSWNRRIGIGSAFLLTGEDSPTEKAGLLPYLLDEDGKTKMQGQTEHILRDLTLSMGTIAATKDTTANIPDGYDYRLQVSFTQNTSADMYEVTSPEDIIVEGMTVKSDTLLSGPGSQGQETTSKGYYVYTKLNSYQDNYRVSLNVRKANGAVQTLSGVLQFDENHIPYLEIKNIEDWTKNLGSHEGEGNLGQSYQNILINGTVDFSKIGIGKNVGDYLNIKAAKVRGAKDTAILTGLNYKASRSGEAVFADISGSMENITFKDMIIDSSQQSGGTNIGLIGTLQGEGSGLKFENITIKTGAATNVGCIGTAGGAVTDITLDNIKISARGNYVGGLVGVANGALTDINLTGSKTKAPAESTEKAKADSYGSVIEVTGSYNGAGGICGIAYEPFENLTVTGTSVKGYNRVGAISGYTNESTTNDVTVGTENCSYYDVSVEGTNYVTGISGRDTSGGYSMTRNYFNNVTVQNAYISATNSFAAGVSTNAVRVDNANILGCYIVSSKDHAAGMVNDWNNVTESTVSDSTIIAGSNAAGIGSYAVSVTDCMVTGCTISATNGCGGVMARNYTSTVNSVGVVDCTIGSANSTNVGGLVGYNYSDGATSTYTIVYNSYVKDTSVTANNNAGGIMGYARGGRFENVYTNANVTAYENAGGLAGLADGYIMNSSSYRRLQISGFYFRGKVSAGNKNAGGLFGLYSFGNQEYNSDGTEYLGEYLPQGINVPTSKTDGTQDTKTDYMEKILIASDSVTAGNNSTEAVVMNLEKGRSENGTTYGTIPQLYIWEKSNTKNTSLLGSKDVTSTKLATQDFYDNELKLSSSYWNYMGLSASELADASVLPQENGKLLLNTGDQLPNGPYDVQIMTDNYVQDDSLKLWLDALNNTGSGFNPDAGYWTNLVTAENGDAESYKLNNFARGSWKSNGLHFSGTNQYIDTVNNGELGSTVYEENGTKYTGATISVMVKMDTDNYGKHNYLFCNRSADLGGFELHFNKNGRTYLYGDDMPLNAGSSSGTFAEGFYTGDGSWPALYNTQSEKNIEGRYVQLTLTLKTVLSATGNQTTYALYLDGDKLYENTRNGGFESRFGNLFRIGLNWYNSEYGAIKGTIGSVMGYDRVLSKEEVAQNARMNQMRYNSTIRQDEATSGIVTKTNVEVKNGKALIQLTSTERQKLLKDEESKDSQLYVRIEKAAGSYIGGSTAYPLGVHAPIVESTAYADADLNDSKLAANVDETDAATGTGWDYRNEPYVHITKVSAATSGNGLDDIHYQWYSSTTGGYDGNAISGATSNTMQLTGSGYFYCKVTATETYTDSTSGESVTRTVYGYSKVYRHMAESYMPYVRSRQSAKNYATLPGQEGSYTDSNGTKVYYSTADGICSGGVPVPSDSTTTMALMRSMWLMGSASEPAPAVQAYASGANTLNVEFDSNIPFEDETYFGTTWFTIEADGQDVVLPEGTLIPMTFTDTEGKERTGYYIDTRVYSLTYDFQTELTITTWSEFFDAMTGDTYLDSQSCEVVPEQVARRVMTWGDAYAYINNKDMINGNIGKIAHDGGFVNLYGGKALTEDGQIVDMSDLEPVEKPKTKEDAAEEESKAEDDSKDAKEESTGTATVVERDVTYEAAETAMTVLQESVPLYTGEYEGYGIRTYAGFTQTIDGAGETYVSSRQLFVKNGQLFTMDVSTGDGTVQDGYILDTYQNYRYMTVLNTADPHDLTDVEQPIHYPSDFANYNIAHISNTLDNSSDNHIVMGYYSHGTVWGFNYFTGEWLDLGSDAEGGNFVTYLLGSIRAKFFNTLPVTNPEYQNALKLETNLGVYLLENGKNLPEGARSGYGDTVDDGSLRSLDTEKAIPTEHPGVTNANGDVDEAGGSQDEGTKLAQTDTALASNDRAKAEASEDELQTSGGVLQKMDEDTATAEADQTQQDATVDEAEENGSSSLTKVGAEDAQQTGSGAGTTSDAEGIYAAAGDAQNIAGTAADLNGIRAAGNPTEEGAEAPENPIDGESAADGTAVSEDANDGRQLADASLTTVYNTSTGNYGVYTTEDILTATDEKLQTVDTRLVNMGADLTPIYIGQSNTLTEKEQSGVRVLILISGGVVVLLAGMMMVHTRKRKRR